MSPLNFEGVKGFEGVFSIEDHTFKGFEGVFSDLSETFKGFKGFKES
jgi:hypothetical protein